MSSPLLTSEAWTNPEVAANRADVMTIEGTAVKTGILTLIMAVAIGVMWDQFWNGGQPNLRAMMPWAIGAGLASLVIGVIGCFAPRYSMFLGFAMAVVEGIFLGAVTMLVHTMYPGLPLLAAVFTLATLVGTLILYGTRIVRTSPAFVKGVMVATGALFLGMLVVWGLSMIGFGELYSTLRGGGPIAIGFSVLCIVLATFNLLVDFHYIEEGAKQRAPKWMEWAGALGLLVTMVWLYIEILRLLQMLRGSSDD